MRCLAQGGAVRGIVELNNEFGQRHHRARGTDVHVGRPPLNVVEWAEPPRERGYRIVSCDTFGEEIADLPGYFK